MTGFSIRSALWALDENWGLHLAKIIENINPISRKGVTPLERHRKTEKNDLFPSSLGCISQEIQNNQYRQHSWCACLIHCSCVQTLSFKDSHSASKNYRGSSNSLFYSISRFFFFILQFIS